MAAPEPNLLNAVAANCLAQATAVGEALSLAFEVPLQVHSAVECPALEPIVEQCHVPGLLVVLRVGPSALLLALPERVAWLPAWCRMPDATAHSRLAALAQKLGVVMLPEHLLAEEVRAGWVADVAVAFERSGLEATSGVEVQLAASQGDGPRMLIVWPARNPTAALIDAPAVAPQAQPKGGETAAASTARNRPVPRKAPPVPEDLPNYSRSLLMIKVPVMVTLASKRQPLGRIVELGPGAIIHFEKSCEEMLDLEVGGQVIAQGEPIKVGDKFGIRLTSLTLPHERFVALGKGQAGR